MGDVDLQREIWMDGHSGVVSIRRLKRSWKMCVMVAMYLGKGLEEVREREEESVNGARYTR
jgi:hypothetical protein